MKELVRIADKHGETIFLLTNTHCLVVGGLIVFGGIGIIWFGLSLIRVGVKLG